MPLLGSYRSTLASTGDSSASLSIFLSVVHSPNGQLLRDGSTLGFTGRDPACSRSRDRVANPPYIRRIPTRVVRKTGAIKVDKGREAKYSDEEKVECLKGIHSA
jgi:hypothetical protein